MNFNLYLGYTLKPSYTDAHAHTGERKTETETQRETDTHTEKQKQMDAHRDRGTSYIQKFLKTKPGGGGGIYL